MTTSWDKWKTVHFRVCGFHDTKSLRTFFLFLSKTRNNFYFLILLVKLSAIWFVICTNIITAVWQVYGPSAATFFRLVYFALSRFVSMSNHLKLEFIFPSILSSKIIWDQYQYLGNCPPTPPLTQQQSIDKNLGLMLGWGGVGEQLFRYWYWSIIYA